MRFPTIVIAIAALLVGVLVWDVVKDPLSLFLPDRQAVKEAEFRTQALIQLNDSLTARYARLQLEKDSLTSLVAAAKRMKGKLVAGVKIDVKPETVWVASKPVPTSHVDSTRVGVLEDSASGYHVRIEATAPPFPAPLRIGYNLRTPRFSPEIGFVQRNGETIAVVAWDGQVAEASTGYSYFAPLKQRRILGVVGTQAWVSPDLGNPFGVDVFAGLRLRHKQWEAQGVLGQRRSPYLGASLIRTF